MGAAKKTETNKVNAKNNIAKKVVETTSQVFKFFELSIEELSKLGPRKIEDAMDEFDKEIQNLKQRLLDLDEEKKNIKNELKQHKRTKKELIQRLRNKRIWRFPFI